MIFSPSKILFGDQFKTNETGGTFGTDRGQQVYRVLVGETGGKRALGIPKFRWVDNIKVDLIETE